MYADTCFAGNDSSTSCYSTRPGLPSSSRLSRCIWTRCCRYNSLRARMKSSHQGRWGCATSEHRGMTREDGYLNIQMHAEARVFKRKRSSCMLGKSTTDAETTISPITACWCLESHGAAHARTLQWLIGFTGPLRLALLQTLVGVSIDTRSDS